MGGVSVYGWQLYKARLEIVMPNQVAKIISTIDRFKTYNLED